MQPVENKYHTVSSFIEFDYGHRVPNHDSKCRNLHGHRAKVEIRVEGPLVLGGAKDGMVIDFGDLKRLLMKHVHDLFDHTLILQNTDILFTGGVVGMSDPMKRLLWADPVAPVLWSGFYVDLDSTLVVLSCAPTAENLCYAIWQIVQKHLPSDRLRLLEVIFWETPNNKSSYGG